MISNAVVRLVQNHTFLAHVILNMRRIYTTRVPTAGVNITNQVNLVVNPDFWKSLSDAEQEAVLLHEVYHIIFNHIGRMPKITQKWNIAADLAINQYIPNLPNGSINLATFPNLQLEELQTMEYYYEKLGDVEGLETLDDHNEWGNVDPELARERLRDIVRRAESAVGAGKIPGHLVEAIAALSKSRKNWKNELRRFVSNSRSSERKSSRKIRNRRYGLLYPGHKKKDKLNIAVAVDTSGSISLQQLVQFFTEIEKIHKAGANITIIECDSEVQPGYKYDPKKKIEVHGGGGTAFGPAFEEASKHDIDGLIYFTDGDCFDIPPKPNFPILWAIVGNSKPPLDYGAVTRVEVT